MRRAVRLPALLALLAVLPLTGCLFRTHKVERHASTAAIKEASLEELIGFINAEAAKVRTLNATVDIAPSIGGAKRGKVTEIQEMRGYVLVRKPNQLRMIGLFPILRNTAFDMVSNGEDFRLSIPAKNRFVVGANQIERPSDKPLENLRPQHIFDALFLQEIDPREEIVFVEGSTEIVHDPVTKKDAEEPTYVVTVLRRDGDLWKVRRKIVFNRADLLPHRQIVYDRHSNVATEAEYEQFTEYDGLRFPSAIRIWRPQEEYAIQLFIVKLKLNQPLSDSQFVLEQPPGSELQRLDAPSEPGKTTASKPEPKSEPN
ncbi:MAG: LolA family protein [Terriglobales bacterium]